MKNKNIILVGGGGHARAAADIIKNSMINFNIIGYADIKKNNDMYPYKYLGTDDILVNYVDSSCFLVTVGQIKSYIKRKELFDLLININAQIISVSSKNSYISSSSNIDFGTIVMHGAIIQANVEIGKNCIINDKSLIEHDCKVGNHCHISTGAILNGNVSVGNGVFIGSSAVIKNNVTIADDCVIGMGVIIKHDILKPGTLIKSNNYN